MTNDQSRIYEFTNLRIYESTNLRQLLQDRLNAGPVTRVLADVAPNDAPVRLNDEHGWCSETIAQQAVYAVSGGDLVRGVGQQGIGGPRALSYSIH